MSETSNIPQLDLGDLSDIRHLNYFLPRRVGNLGEERRDTRHLPLQPQGKIVGQFFLVWSVGNLGEVSRDTLHLLGNLVDIPIR